MKTPEPNDPKLRNSTPFDLAKQDIDDLFDEAKVWLEPEDGNPPKVETQEQADILAKIITMVRTAGGALEKGFKDEKRPILDAGNVLADKYKPSRDRVKLISDVAKKVLSPFIVAQEAEKRRIEQAKRDEADRAEQAAQDAIQKTNSNDIEEREAAESMVDAAKDAHAHANRSAKDRGGASGGGRKITTRKFYTPELVDVNAAIKHYWAVNPTAFHDLVVNLAVTDVRKGSRSISGFKINEESKVA